MKNFDTTLFEILGRLPHDATEEEINRAYKLLAQLYHPDKNSSERSVWASENMKQLNQAREILADPVKRKQYERVLQEKLAVQKQEAVRLQSLQNQNWHLTRQAQTVQQANKDLTTVLGLAAVALIIGALSD